MSSEHRAPGHAEHSTLPQTSCVIFDFDGVVADSETLSLGTLQKTLAAYDFAMSLDAVRDQFLGKSLKTIAAHFQARGRDGQMDGFEEAWQSELFAAFATGLGVMPGLIDLLESLERSDMRYCIASSSSFERLGVALDAIGLADRFPMLFSAEQVENGKPAPDLFLLAASQMQVDPRHCLVIEDSPFGVRAARMAGMQAVGFVGGSHLADIRPQHAAKLKNEGARPVIEHLASMTSAIGQATMPQDPRR